eukprot:g4362.t1
MIKNNSSASPCKTKTKSDTGGASRLTKELLTSGGDDRLLLDKNQVNKYQTPAYPEPRGIHRSSCTSNCVTDYTFHTVGEPLVRKLKEVAAAPHGEDVDEPLGSKQHDIDELVGLARLFYTEEIDSIRDEIRNVWKLPRVGNSITLCPSGSDAEYLPLLLAISRVLKLSEGSDDQDVGGVGSGILTIVTGAGEVGSGTLNAAKGKFFSNVGPKDESVSVVPDVLALSTTPATAAAAQSNCPVKTGDPVFQLPKHFPPIEAVEVYMRNNEGSLKSALEADEEVKEVVRRALQEQGFRQVVVHVVAGSKTGHLIPSVTVLDELRSEFGEKSIVPVIDACQGRLQEGALKQFLEKNYVVLTTGSKFYGGPPFSGAVLLPSKLSHELDSEYEHIWKKNDLLHRFPLFMDDALLSRDLPKMREFIREELSTEEKNWHYQRPNWGVVLRWKMALNEIRLYHSIPLNARDAILAAWVKSTKQIVEDLQSPFLACPEDEFRAAVADAGTGSRRATEEEAVYPGSFVPSMDHLDLRKGMFLTNTIVSLVCRVPEGDPSKQEQRRLNIDELKILHKLMAQDLSGGKIPGLDETAVITETESYKELPGPYGNHVVETIGDVLSTKCYIAQPVQIEPGPQKNALSVIRVTIGAPLVHWVWEKMKMKMVPSIFSSDDVAWSSTTLVKEDANGLTHFMKRVSISETPENLLQETINFTAQSDLIVFLKMQLLLKHWDQVGAKK